MTQVFLDAATAGDISRVIAMLRDDPSLARLRWSTNETMSSIY
jgi:hypothetical protein